MAKKRNRAAKRKSARGHNEDRTLRYRLHKKLIRVDRDGNPISPDCASPIDIPHTQRALAQAMKESGADKPVQSKPVPDNLVAFKQKDNTKPVASAGNEAEKTEDVPHLKFDKAPDINHNPLLKSEAGGYAPPYKPKADTPASNDPIATDKGKKSYSPYPTKKPVVKTGLTPSGKPIKEFLHQCLDAMLDTEGDDAPPEDTVVYTTEALNDLPPTATRDWRSQLDNSVKVRKAPDENSSSYKIAGMIQWYIANVEVQNWPMPMYRFARFNSDGYVINTGEVNKACSTLEEENDVLRHMFAGLERQYRMIDIAYENASQEVSLLKQELESEKCFGKLVEYQLAHHTGDIASKEEIARELNIISNPETPDTADEMLAQFNVYQSFVKCDGPEHAFARYVYGDPRYGEVIRDAADERLKERQEAFESRETCRNMSKFLTELGAHAEEQYVQWWKNEYPNQRRAQLKRLSKRNATAVVDVGKERVKLARMAHQATIEKHRSIYYSSLPKIRTTASKTLWSNEHGSATMSYADYGDTTQRKRYRNNLVAGVFLSEAKPAKCRHWKVGYELWWSRWLDYCEVKYHESTVTGRVKIGIVKAYNKSIDLLNTPVDPGTRKRKAARMQQIITERSERDERREARKEMKQQRKEERKQKEHLRKMYGMAH